MCYEKIQKFTKQKIGIGCKQFQYYIPKRQSEKITENYRLLGSNIVQLCRRYEQVNAMWHYIL